MKIEITPELLVDLKDKAKGIKQGLWVFQKDGSDYYPEHQFFTTPTRDHLGSDGGNVTFNTADNDFFNVMDYITAANPAVMLALIAKIEQLENENTALSNSILSYQEKLSHYEKTNP